MKENSKTFFSVVCALISLMFLPPIFGAIAIYFGYSVKKTSPNKGYALMVFGGVCLIIGAIVGAFSAILLYL